MSPCTPSHTLIHRHLLHVPGPRRALRQQPRAVHQALTVWKKGGEGGWAPGAMPSPLLSTQHDQEAQGMSGRCYFSHKGKDDMPRSPTTAPCLLPVLTLVLVQPHPRARKTSSPALSET